MSQQVAFIGFGEAGQAFASAGPGSIRVYDKKTGAGATRLAKLDDYRRAGVDGRQTNHSATADAALILSMVTADQALSAARETARSIAPNALYCDLNSVAPDTKRLAAEAIEDVGGHYVDVAVMAPVLPKCLAVPLLISGPHAEAGSAALLEFGFSNVRIVGAQLGAASAIKMIRSVMIKGMEALTAEFILAAEAAGVRDEVIASLNASAQDADWGNRADYNLDRMMLHGLRRAAEMHEVVKTLDALGTGSAMARATAARQHMIGSLGIAPPESLDAKLAALLEPLAKDKAA